MAKKTGRPSKFNQQISDKIIELALKGKTDKQIAEVVGVAERTLNMWKQKTPEFMQSLKEAKQAADELVEVSLYRRACGYTHDEEKIFCHEGKIVRANTTKHYPPDVTAMIFWLKNRQPDKWRENGPVDPNEDKPKKLIIHMTKSKKDVG